MLLFCFYMFSIDTFKYCLTVSIFTYIVAILYSLFLKLFIIMAFDTEIKVYSNLRKKKGTVPEKRSYLYLYEEHIPQ